MTERDAVWLRRYNEQQRLAWFYGERRTVHATPGGNHVERALHLDKQIALAQRLIEHDGDIICELSRPALP